jgi:hypothetical protein
MQHCFFITTKSKARKREGEGREGRREERREEERKEERRTREGETAGSATQVPVDPGINKLWEPVRSLLGIRFSDLTGRVWHWRWDPGFCIFSTSPLIFPTTNAFLQNALEI